jgi:hypothetical protein
LTLALLTCLRNMAFKVFDVLGDIKSDIRSAQDRKDRRLIIEWLSKSSPDPSKEHNIARDKHQPTTGSWLINGEKLQTWIESKNSLLWLCGGGMNRFFDHFRVY